MASPSSSVGRWRARSPLPTPRHRISCSGTRLDNREKAKSGLESGEYYAAIVIPKDYSQRLASLSGPPTSVPPFGRDGSPRASRDRVAHEPGGHTFNHSPDRERLHRHRRRGIWRDERANPGRPLGGGRARASGGRGGDLRSRQRQGFRSRYLGRRRTASGASEAGRDRGSYQSIGGTGRLHARAEHQYRDRGCGLRGDERALSSRRRGSRVRSSHRRSRPSSGIPCGRKSPTRSRSDPTRATGSRLSSSPSWRTSRAWSGAHNLLPRPRRRRKSASAGSPSFAGGHVDGTATAGASLRPSDIR